MEAKLVRGQRHGILLIVIWSGIALALFAAGCSGGGPGQAPPEAEGRAVAEPFLAEIRGGKFDAAWESTTAEFKSDMGRETFRRFARSKTALKEPLEYTGFEPDATNGITRGACDFRTPTAARVQAKVRILVARENDQWKVERLIVE